jgi:hypothetical protein
MKSFYCLLFLLFTYASGISQDEEKNYRLLYPEFIPVNSPFELSIVIANTYLSADHLELYFINQGNVELTKIKFKSFYSSTYVPFKSASLEGYSGHIYKAEIYFYENKLSLGEFFQLILNLKSENVIESTVKMIGIFKDSSKVLGYLEDLSPDNSISAELKFYNPQKNAGKCLQFKNSSIFSVSFPNLRADSLLAEFWFKSSGLPSSFLTVKSRLNFKDEFYLSANDFQMFSVQSEEINFGELKPFFISKNAWYHFEILFLFQEKTIAVYCGGDLLTKKELSKLIRPEDLEFVFSNNSDEIVFQIDLLRFIEYNNSIEASVVNFNYVNFISDSSEVLYQFNFDGQEENLNQNLLKINFSGTQLVKSDAPVFVRAPELNISVMSKIYQLEWSGGDFRQAAFYVLEKSLGNFPFTEIFTVRSENSGEKVYTYLDKKDDNSDIVYYRVKQINKDGSLIYSSQVKVGQGILTPFFIEQNFPNPFNPKTSIYIELFEDTEVEITIYNLEGGEIAKIHKGFLRKGKHKFSFDATGLPSGIYLYKVDTPIYSEIKKMILTK